MIPIRPFPPSADIIHNDEQDDENNGVRRPVQPNVSTNDQSARETSDPVTTPVTVQNRSGSFDRSTARMITITFDRGTNTDPPDPELQSPQQSPTSSLTGPDRAPSPESNAFKRSEIAVRRLLSSSSAGGPANESQQNEMHQAVSIDDERMLDSQGDAATIETQRSYPRTNFYTEIHDLPSMQRSELEDMVRHSAIANSCYYDFHEELLKAERILKNDDSILNTAWRHFELPRDVQMELGLSRFRDGRLYHQQSDLILIMLQNDELKSVAVGYGGTTAGKERGNLFYRMLTNRLSSFRHWMHNFQSIGLLNTSRPAPYSYLKAAEVTERIDRLIKENENGEFDGYQFAATGHSKGAAEAEFSALMNPGIRAVCFSTPPLGRKILNRFPRENLERAKDFIQHYFIKFDPVPSIHVSLKRLLSTGHIGTGQWLPAPAHIVSGPLYPLWAHDSFNDCVGYFADRFARLMESSRGENETRISIADDASGTADDDIQIDTGPSTGSINSKDDGSP